MRNRATPKDPLRQFDEPRREPRPHQMLELTYRNSAGPKKSMTSSKTLSFSTLNGGLDQPHRGETHNQRHKPAVWRPGQLRSSCSATQVYMDSVLAANVTL